jgi:hypothetical protein
LAAIPFQGIAQGAMNYPQEFSPLARARVEAERIRANRELEKKPLRDRRDLYPCILRVFLVFGHEACELGRQGIWTADHIRDEAKEFLRKFTIATYYEKGYDQSGRRFSQMTGNYGGLLSEVAQHFLKSEEWHKFEDELLETAESVGKAESGLPANNGDADGDFWRDLGDSFRALDPVGILWFDWNCPAGDKSQGDWRLAGTTEIRLKNQFIDLATLAGSAIAETKDSDPLKVWLEALREHSPNFESGPHDYHLEGNPDGAGEQKILGGVLNRVCEASADYCKRLELLVRSEEMQQRKLNSTNLSGSKRLTSDPPMEATVGSEATRGVTEGAIVDFSDLSEAARLRIDAAEREADSILAASYKKASEHEADAHRMGLDLSGVGYSPGDINLDLARTELIEGRNRAAEYLFAAAAGEYLKQGRLGNEEFNAKLEAIGDWISLKYGTDRSVLDQFKQHCQTTAIRRRAAALEASERTESNAAEGGFPKAKQESATEPNPNEASRFAQQPQQEPRGETGAVGEEPALNSRSAADGSSSNTRPTARPHICFIAWGPVPDDRDLHRRVGQTGFHLVNDGAVAYEIAIEEFEVEPGVCFTGELINRIVKKSFALAWRKGHRGPALNIEKWQLLDHMATASAKHAGSAILQTGYRVQVGAIYRDRFNRWYRSQADLIYTPSQRKLTFGPTRVDSFKKPTAAGTEVDTIGPVSRRPVQRLQNPSFWRSLRKKFSVLLKRQQSILKQDTHEKWLKTYLDFSKEFGDFGRYKLSGGLDGNLISEFEDLATQAARSLECPPDTDPVGFWLQGLGQDLLKSLKPEIRREFQGDERFGNIRGLLESCVGYCSRLAAKAEREASESRFQKDAMPLTTGGNPSRGVTKGAIGAGPPARSEIKKSAEDAFAVTSEDILKEYAEKKSHSLHQLRPTHNRGGYLPALTKWGEERLRKMVLAYADAYAEAFALCRVPSDELAEKDVETAAQQITAGTISGIRGELDLLEERTGMPVNDSVGHLNRQLQAAMKSAVKKGVLRLRQQRIKSRYAESPSQRVDDTAGQKQASTKAKTRGRRPDRVRRERIQSAITAHGDGWRDHLSDIFKDLDSKDVSVGSFQRMEIDLGGEAKTRVLKWEDLDLAVGEQRTKIIDTLRKYAP